MCTVRDNVLKIHIDKRDDGSIFLCMRSWAHESKPVSKNPIRVYYTNQTHIWPSKDEEGVVCLTEYIQMCLEGSLGGMVNGVLGKETIKTNHAMMQILKKAQQAK